MGRYTISYGDVKAAGACTDRYIFKSLFGKRWAVPVTYTMAKAYAHKIDWVWGAAAFFNEANREAFHEELNQWVADYQAANDGMRDWVKYREFMATCFVDHFIAQGGID